MSYQELIDFAKSIGRFCIGMEGNVSARKNFPSFDGFIIKSSGASLSNLTINDISTYTKDGILIDKGKVGSIETDFHKIIYNICPEINYIAHSHPINTLKILCGNKSLLLDFANKRLYPEQVIFNGIKSSLTYYTKPGKPLAEFIRVTLNYFFEENNFFPKLMLLENHGIIALGKTVQECVAITETCEKAAEVFLGAVATGKIRYLSEASIQELLEDENEKYRISLCK